MVCIKVKQNVKFSKLKYIDFSFNEYLRVFFNNWWLSCWILSLLKRPVKTSLYLYIEMLTSNQFLSIHRFPCYLLAVVYQMNVSYKYLMKIVIRCILQCCAKNIMNTQCIYIYMYEIYV